MTVVCGIFSIWRKIFQNLCQTFNKINHHWWYWRLDYFPLLIACGHFGIKSPKTYAKRSSLDTYKYISFTISLEQDQVPFNSIVVNTLLGWYYWHKVDEPISVAYNPFGIRSVKTYAKLSSLNHVKSLGVNNSFSCVKKKFYKFGIPWTFVLLVMKRQKMFFVEKNVFLRLS